MRLDQSEQQPSEPDLTSSSHTTPGYLPESICSSSHGRRRRRPWCISGSGAWRTDLSPDSSRCLSESLQCSLCRASLRLTAHSRRFNTALISVTRSHISRRKHHTSVCQSKLKSWPPHTCTNRFGGFPSNCGMISVVLRNQTQSRPHHQFDILHWKGKNLQIH